MQPDWIEHRRGRDGELVGWMRRSGDGYVAIDLLGRARTDEVDWAEAEETLNDLGIGYLADTYELLVEDGHWLRVRVAEASAAGVTVKKDDWGAAGAPQIYYKLPFPVPETLQPMAGEPR